MKKQIRVMWTLFLLIMVFCSAAWLKASAEETAAQVATQQELSQALKDPRITKIILKGNIPILNQGTENAYPLLIDRALTIDGGGFSLVAGPEWDGEAGGSLLTVDAGSSPVTLCALGLEGGGLSETGLEIRCTAGPVKLIEMKSSRHQKTGVSVLGSAVDLNGLVTEQNGYGGVLVAREGQLVPCLTRSGSYTSVQEAMGIFALPEEGYQNYFSGPKLNFAAFYADGTPQAYAVEPSARRVEYVSTQQALQDAINDPAATEIILTGNITISRNGALPNQGAVNITRTTPLVIDGNGFQLTADTADWQTADRVSVLNLENSSAPVTIENLTINGSGVSRHGINVYNSTGVRLINVTSENNGATGLTVNSSQVTAENLTTSANGWGGVNVGKGTAQGLPAPNLALEGTYSSQNEAAGIYIDPAEAGSVNNYITPPSGEEVIIDPATGAIILRPKTPVTPVTPPETRPNPQTGIPDWMRPV